MAEIKGRTMATPKTNLSKGVPKYAAPSRNAERETRRPASEGCVINDIVEGFSRERWLMRGPHYNIQTPDKKSRI